MAGSSWSAVVRRLVKAANTQDPIDPHAPRPTPGLGVQEGQNERETETFDPSDRQVER